MKNRLEYKYLLPLRHLDALRKNLLPYMVHDEYAAVRPQKEYTVRSLYLDTTDFRCYKEKIDGIMHRKKFRMRVYNNRESNAIVYFEIKRKHDGFISKERARVPIRDFAAALEMPIDAAAFLSCDPQQMVNFLYHYHTRHLEPKTVVMYEREPFQCRFGSNLRITFDKNLRTKPVSGFDALFDENEMISNYRGKFIFEIKFFQVLPQWITPILNTYGLTRCAVSKYAASIDAQRSTPYTLAQTSMHVGT